MTNYDIIRKIQPQLNIQGERNMNVKDLKTYVGNTFKLEVSLYNQRQLFNRINNRINKLSHISDKSFEASEPVKWWTIIPYGLLSAIIGAMIGVIICAFAFPSPDPTPADIRRIIICASIAFGLYFAYWLLKLIGTIQNNQAIKQDNRQIASENRKLASSIALEKQLLNYQLVKIRASYQKTSDALKQYYSLNIIYPKYRNLTAVGSFYDYLCAGRCSKLEGHEGAYNIFEDELLHKIIISRLDDIIERLDEIRSNQYMLYSAIKESNENTNRMYGVISKAADSLQNIEQNTAVSAYYDGITAQNSEVLTWLAILK